MFGFGTKDQILGILRHVITFVGGLLVAKGKLDPQAVETIGGAVISIVGFFLSMAAPEKQPITAEKVIAQLGPVKTAAVERAISDPKTDIRPSTPSGTVGVAANPASPIIQPPNPPGPVG